MQVNKTVIDELKELTKNYNIYSLYLDFDKSCPSCGHNAKLGNTPRILCPKCSKAYDVIDILKFKYNVDNLELLKLLRNNKLNIAPVNKNRLLYLRNQHMKKDVELLKHQQKINNMIIHNSTNLTDNSINYLKHRGIYGAVRLIDKNIIDIRTNTYMNKETILYRFKKQKTAIQKSIHKNDTGQRFVRNLGSVSPISHRSPHNTTNEFIILEGIEDALSSLVLNKNFICLNSASNFKKFESIITKSPSSFQKFKFELCTDNDEKGLECMGKLEYLFKKFNLQYSISDYFLQIQDLNLKDLNDLIMYNIPKTEEEPYD